MPVICDGNSMCSATAANAIPKLTLDTNCIIDLEKSTGAALHLASLLQLHRAQQIKLRVVAISASERTPSGGYLADFMEFEKRIESVGLSTAEILRPIGYYDVTYWGWFLWADEKMFELERKIHSVLFPDIPFEYSEAKAKRWRNAKCDVLALWSHIFYHGDIFVTSDPDFYKATKKSRLIALGAGDILTPEAALVRIHYCGSQVSNHSSHHLAEAL